MSILSELKKLTGKNNATVVSEALPDSMGGGSEPLVVTFSGTTDGEDAACDKTWNEISAAGENVIFYYSIGGGKVRLLESILPGSTIFLTHQFFDVARDAGTNQLVILSYHSIEISMTPSEITIINREQE